MSQQNILFEDNLVIQSIDKDGKYFDKVSRIEGIAEDSQCEIQLDINCDIYPINKQSLYGIMLAESLNTDGSTGQNYFNYESYINKNTLMEKFDYVMYGKFFRYTKNDDGRIMVLASFGGLLFSITGQPKVLQNLAMDQRVYLLLKKITK